MGDDGVPGARILIVRLGALGDIVHTLPLARALRASRPGAFIGWAVEERYRELVEADPDVDLVIPIPRWRGGRSGLVPATGWIRAIRRARFDTAIDAQGLLKSSLVAFTSGARRRIGFHRRDRREALGAWLTTDPVPPADAAYVRHVARKNLALLGALGIPLDERAPVAFPGLVAEWTGSRPRRVALHPGAGWKSKTWPVERYAELGDVLSGESGLEVLLTWGPGDEEAARAVAARMGSPVTVLGACGPLGLARELARCRLAIGGDTGPVHLAAALGVPVVSLFGPTDPRRNGPLGPAPVRTLWVDRSCRNCWKRRCPRGEECLGAIPVAEVARAARELLDQS